MRRYRPTASTSTRPSARRSTSGAAAYSNPSQGHIGGKKIKNWDSAVRRADLESDGVAGEVIFPNMVPPFYETAYHIAPSATDEDYLRKRQGTRAHNRWLADFCAEEYDRHAGIGLISGQGTPVYTKQGQGSNALWAMEMSFFVQRGVTHVTASALVDEVHAVRLARARLAHLWE